MNFSEQLNKYISIIGCSAKELSEKSSISSSVISRYRNNQKKPEKGSPQLENLTNALVQIASTKGLSKITYDRVLSNFNSTLNENNANTFEQISNNFDKLLSICNINMAEMSRSLNMDPSNLSRIRNNKRKPSDPEQFIDSVCSYIVRRYNSNPIKETISHLIGCEKSELSNQSNYLSKLKGWLYSRNPSTDNCIDDFLKKLDDFDLDEYIRTIHFDELKVPSVPFQFPTSRNYYGIEEMKKGELDFFKATVLSKSNEPVFMCSDMPMEDMAEDVDFGKKWMFAIAMTLKKGLHLDIIHNLDRPFKEMMLGLESWIPIYMTGQISPFYLKGIQNNVYHHFNYVSGNYALSGECINGNHNKGKYYLTNNKEEVSYYRDKANSLISKAHPLMDIYLKNSSNLYTAFINSDSKTIGNRRRILSSIPIFTISDNILNKMLERSSIPNDNREKIFEFINNQRELVQTITENNTLLDEITEFSKEEFEKFPVSLNLSGMFFEEKIYYTYEEYIAHIKLTKEYAKCNKNYVVQTNNNNAFRNIQIFIHEGKWVMISKESHPTIHFVIHHPKLCNAIENFIAPVVVE
ncbi:MAG: hypothetical protein Q4G05_01350 [Clostridia bacterium]|nr:hypothetical protein [Clostridia bacterium]